MKQRGFTLMELLMVIAILGIIAAMVALNVANYLGPGRNETQPSDLGIINATIFTELAGQPISTLNLTALQDVVDYCHDRRLYDLAKLYQNQIIISLLTENGDPTEK